MSSISKLTLSVSSSHLFYMTENSRQKFKYLENKKTFSDEIKSIFDHFWKTNNKFFFSKMRVRLWCINLQQTIFYSTSKKQTRSIWKTSNVKKQRLPHRKLVKLLIPPNRKAINCKATHIKSFVHGQPPASQKYFLILCMNFDCLQMKEKNKNSKKAFDCDK